MTMERFKEMSPNHFTPVDIILEWKKNEIVLHHGEMRTNIIEKINGKLSCQDESVDKIVLSGICKSDVEFSYVMQEARRILKKNGRIFIAVKEKNHGINLFSRMKSKLNVIDKIASAVNEQSLLIDKNFILNDDHVYLEVVKLESDYLKRKIVI